MNRSKVRTRLLALGSAGVFTLAACGGGGDDGGGASTGGAAANGDAPSWFGSDEIVLGITDGCGGNS